MQPASFLAHQNGQRVAYHATAGSGPGVIFLTGFKSDMGGTKALALEAHCREAGQAFVRFDYRGHGASDGAFEEGAIGDWLQDALLAFDHLTHGPQIVVGSSMGGWIACLLALRRPERVAGLVGLAAAPDFTERLIWEQMKEPEQEAMQSRGYIEIPNCYGEEPYRITRRLVEEGRSHLILQGAINITCPMRLLHGMKDEDVPWQMAQALLERVASKDVELTLIKDGNHRLSEPANLELLCQTLKMLSCQRKLTSS